MLSDLDHVTRNPIILVSAILAWIGWFIAFIGTAYNGRWAGIRWWFIIYELFLLISIFFTIWRRVFHHYRVKLAILLGISITYLTSFLDATFLSIFSSDKAAGAGAFILIVMQFFWIVVYGSTSDSFVYQTIHREPVLPTAAVGAKSLENVHSPSNESKIGLSSSNEPAQPQDIHTSTTSAVPPNAQSPNSQHANIVVKFTTQALHPYQANPEDPNELSFAKDDKLEILSDAGNWWQARDHHGKVGIVPSNYFPNEGNNTQ